MDKVVVIILVVILLLLIILNHLSITVTKNGNSTDNGCSQTRFGCCPDGVNSKINFKGTNCPRYNPGVGYPPPPPIRARRAVHAANSRRYNPPGYNPPGYNQPGYNPPGPRGGAGYNPPNYGTQHIRYPPPRY